MDCVKCYRVVLVSKKNCNTDITVGYAIDCDELRMLVADMVGDIDSHDTVRLDICRTEVEMSEYEEHNRESMRTILWRDKRR